MQKDNLNLKQADVMTTDQIVQIKRQWAIAKNSFWSYR